MTPEQNSLTLYAVEGWLETLRNTEDLVEPDQQQAFEAELGQALRSVDRTEQVAQTMFELESGVAFAKGQIKRIEGWIERRESWLERLRQGVLDFIKALGKDQRTGKYPQLKGRTTVLAARANPASVIILDGDKVPAKYKRCAIDMRYDQWITLVAAFPALTAGCVKEVRPDKAAIRAAIELRGEKVPGADLDLSKYHLGVRS